MCRQPLGERPYASLLLKSYGSQQLERDRIYREGGGLVVKGRCLQATDLPVWLSVKRAKPTVIWKGVPFSVVQVMNDKLWDSPKRSLNLTELQGHGGLQWRPESYKIQSELV